MYIGWTPLMTCCMSFATVSIADRLIQKTINGGGNGSEGLDCKTITGPGNFNSGWTALHMSSAYGVEPLGKSCYYYHYYYYHYHYYHYHYYCYYYHY